MYNNKGRNYKGLDKCVSLTSNLIILDIKKTSCNNSQVSTGRRDNMETRLALIVGPQRKDGTLENCPILVFIDRSLRVRDQQKNVQQVANYR